VRSFSRSFKVDFDISLFPTECRSNLVASVVLADVKACFVRLSRGCVRGNSYYECSVYEFLL
jgi:hypothetical protein